MFSGADLAAMINEAAIIATMADKDFVETSDLEEARDKVRWGRARREPQGRGRGPRRHRVPRGRARGRADPARDADPLHKVTIIPRGARRGRDLQPPREGPHGYGRKYIEATLRVLCGGRIAEEKQDRRHLQRGVSMDIQMATQYARHDGPRVGHERSRRLRQLRRERSARDDLLREGLLGRHRQE